MIREIEEAIVARLAEALPKLHVAAFPDKPDTFKMHHPAGAVLVAYGREVHGKPRGLSLVVQVRPVSAWGVWSGARVLTPAPKQARASRRQGPGVSTTAGAG